ncbi:hypothetical protein QFZ34_002220 [Phyllobacterium ifriqiyense]|uniref:TonB C-terminal domain-containing protein n=1 Tax=Phyllobacterium ifriqiyense TaxID=314238 RepID=A0ABU0S8F4_9HYPH|nr:cell envelope integrity protein TolA [Phyllobacterium ifriqiyense]MDQ0997038.1 hypothetical protein [Phyllobacterium ifriqiyense]
MAYSTKPFFRIALIAGIALGLASPSFSQTPVPDPQQKTGGQAGLLSESEIKGNRDIVVVVKLRLSRAGKIIGTPIVSGKGGDFITRSKMKNRALRSVYRAQPFKLSPDKYDQWSQVTLTFYP